MRYVYRKSLFLIVLVLASLAAGVQTKAEFPLKDGDVWVMAGDSITAQHLHSNYFEAFCFARYPQLKFAFRNSGVGGHTIPTTLARFEYDIAAWKPTVVAASLTAKELAAGVNLTALDGPPEAKAANPIVAQARAILMAVATKEGVVSQWRGLSQKAHAAGAPAELKEQLSALTTKVEEADGKIREAARPQKLHFELSAAR